MVKYMKFLQFKNLGEDLFIMNDLDKSIINTKNRLNVLKKHLENDVSFCADTENRLAKYKNDEKEMNKSYKNLEKILKFKKNHKKFIGKHILNIIGTIFVIPGIAALIITFLIFLMNGFPADFVYVIKMLLFVLKISEVLFVIMFIPEVIKNIKDIIEINSQRKMDYDESDLLELENTLEEKREAIKSEQFALETVNEKIKVLEVLINQLHLDLMILFETKKFLLDNASSREVELPVNKGTEIVKQYQVLARTKK